MLKVDVNIFTNSSTSYAESSCCSWNEDHIATLTKTLFYLFVPTKKQMLHSISTHNIQKSISNAFLNY